MATGFPGKAISALTGITSITGAELIPMVQSGVTDSCAIGIVTASLTSKKAVRVASTADLNTVYSNGTSGIGATLTNNGALVAIAVDGVNLALNDRILVKDQTNAYENGIYYVTTVGDGTHAWVITRTLDFNNSQSNQLAEGADVIITEGLINARTNWFLLTASPYVIGTTNLTFSSMLATGNSPSSIDPFVRVITAGFAALATAGTVTVQTHTSATSQFLVLDMKVLKSTGLSGGGGDRLLSLTDATIVFNNTGITAALLGTPVYTLFGGAGNPVSNASSTSTAGADIVLTYIGGATDFTAGSVQVAVTLVQVTT